MSMKIECDICKRQAYEEEKNNRDKWHVVEIDEDVKIDLCHKCYLKCMDMFIPGFSEMCQ